MAAKATSVNAFSWDTSNIFQAMRKTCSVAVWELSWKRYYGRVCGNSVLRAEWHTLSSLNDLSSCCVGIELHEDKGRNRKTVWDTFTMLQARNESD